MLLKKTVLRAVLFVGMMPITGSAQMMDHAGHMATMLAGTNNDERPQEPGQSGFAAIAEIVAMLRSDPATDWLWVDIAALRDHLVDMDRLITETKVGSSEVPGGIQMTIDLSQDGNAAAGRMVPAHASVLTAETGWTSEIVQHVQTLVWTVTAPGNEAQIRGLGFFGLMALGNHHTAHHMAVARGETLH